MKALPATWQALVENETQERHIRRRVRQQAARGRTVDPTASAKIAGLHYINDATTPGIRRIGKGARVRYVDPRGRTVANRQVLQRIRSLAIPPAWTSVWISPDALSHLQATGRDARGRKQYRYHPRWRDIRDEVKYGRLIAFSEALPQIRAKTRADLERRGLPREKVLATVVQLLEKTLIRVGNDEYARTNHSYGLTTLRDGHTKVNGTKVHFEFRGKSGVSHSVDLHDARLARIVKSCRDLPGQELFQYVDDRDRRQAVASTHVNQYLRAITGEDFTAKDFRTWAGTVMAACALAGATGATSTGAARRNVKRAIESVARRLGNTVTVCRKSYIHPAVVDAYLDGETIAARERNARRQIETSALITAEERAVVRLIRRRVGAASGTARATVGRRRSRKAKLQSAGAA